MKLILLILTLNLLSAISFSQKTPGEKAEDAISKYLTEQFKDKSYKAYYFGDLVKITPSEIISLDSLKHAVDSLQRRGKLNDSLTDLYDLQMKEKLKKIRSNKLFPTYEMDHFFVIREPFKEEILYHTLFTLYPDGKVKDIDNILTYELTDEEHDNYYHYYRKYALYKNKPLNHPDNNKTYQYLENLYLNELDDKKAAFSTVLSVVECMRKTGMYDTVYIAQNQASKHLNTIVDVEFSELTYSKITPIKLDSNSTLPDGYNMFVRVKNKDEKAYYFEFDYDYIIRGVLPVKEPFDSYFE